MKGHDRPYGCTFMTCNRVFGSKNDWKRHENSQHFHLEIWRCGETKPDKKICAKVCYRRQTFQEHLRKEHHIQEADIKTKTETCRLGRNCQERFWCGFCLQSVKLKKRGLDAWSERFDHIDDHFMGRAGLAKQSIRDWVPVDSDKPKGEVDSSSNSGDYPVEESSASDDFSDGPTTSLFDETGGLGDAINFEARRPEESMKQSKTKISVVVRVCCECGQPHDPRMNTSCSTCDKSHRWCKNCQTGVETVNTDEASPKGRIFSDKKALRTPPLQTKYDEAQKEHSQVSPDDATRKAVKPNKNARFYRSLSNPTGKDLAISKYGGAKQEIGEDLAMSKYGEARQEVMEDFQQVTFPEDDAKGPEPAINSPIACATRKESEHEHEPLPVEGKPQGTESGEEKRRENSYPQDTKSTHERTSGDHGCIDEPILESKAKDETALHSEEHEMAKEFEAATKPESQSGRTKTVQEEIHKPSLTATEERNHKKKAIGTHGSRTKLALSYPKGIVANLHSQCSLAIAAFIDLYKQTPGMIGIEAQSARMLDVMSERLFLWGESLEPADMEYLTLWSCDLQETIVQYLINISQGIIYGLACQIEPRPEHSFYTRVTQLSSSVWKGAGSDLADEALTSDHEHGHELVDLIEDIYTSVECLMDLTPSIVRVLHHRDATLPTDNASRAGLGSIFVTGHDFAQPGNEEEGAPKA